MGCPGARGERGEAGLEPEAEAGGRLHVGQSRGAGQVSVRVLCRWCRRASQQAHNWEEEAQVSIPRQTPDCRGLLCGITCCVQPEFLLWNHGEREDSS